MEEIRVDTSLNPGAQFHKDRPLGRQHHLTVPWAVGDPHGVQYLADIPEQVVLDLAFDGKEFLPVINASGSRHEPLVVLPHVCETMFPVPG
jgi:hypothetical protein